jgi:hypothetical protein
MSFSCWRALGSIRILPSTMILRAFNGYYFKPHGIIPYFLVELGGKIISIEVVIVPLYYNLLFECSWTYVMMVVMSLVF